MNFENTKSCLYFNQFLDIQPKCGVIYNTNCKLISQEINWN